MALVTVKHKEDTGLKLSHNIIRKFSLKVDPKSYFCSKQTKKPEVLLSNKYFTFFRSTWKYFFCCPNIKLAALLILCTVRTFFFLVPLLLIFLNYRPENAVVEIFPVSILCSFCLKFYYAN